MAAIRAAAARALQLGRQTGGFPVTTYNDAPQMDVVYDLGWDDATKEEPVLLETVIGGLDE